jgi:hypothetical protein
MILLPVGVTLLAYSVLGLGLAARSAVRWARRMWQQPAP